MKRERIEDERILQERRKIQSKAYGLLIYGLLLSVLVQQFFLKAPFEQYAVELFSVICMGIYGTINCISGGIDLWESSTYTARKLVKRSLLCGFLVLLCYIILTGEDSITNMIFMAMFWTLSHYIIHLSLNFLLKRRKKQIEQELNQQEEDDE